MAETDFETFLRAVEAWAERDGILGEEQLIFPPREDYGYAATPRNGLAFGTMGVDGVHYVILKLDGEIRDDSPVIQVSPMDGDAYSLLGETLVEYFAHACGVSVADMAAVLERERCGATVLTQFMKDRFDQSRLFKRDRSAEMASYAAMIEVADW